MLEKKCCRIPEEVPGDRIRRAAPNQAAPVHDYMQCAESSQYVSNNDVNLQGELIDARGVVGRNSETRAKATEKERTTC